VTSFFNEIDLEALAERNMLDFISLGHIISNSAVLNYATDKTQLRKLIKTYEEVMKNHIKQDQRSIESEEDQALESFHWNKLGGKLAKANEILKQE
jgi:hypothetical protein